MTVKLNKYFSHVTCYDFCSKPNTCVWTTYNLKNVPFSIYFLYQPVLYYTLLDKLQAWPLNSMTRQKISDFGHRDVWVRSEFMLIWKAYFMHSTYQNAAAGTHQIRVRWQFEHANKNGRIGWYKDAKITKENTN